MELAQDDDVTVKIPDGLERTCQVEIEAGDTLDNTTSFESAIARLQERLDAERSDARADSRAICVAATRKDKGAEDLDVPALSSYEKRAALSEMAGDVAADFETGIGINARAI